MIKSGKIMLVNKKIYVRSGNELWGEVEVSGSKNSALVCLAAACLVTDGSEVVLKNVPRISDVEVMCEIIKNLGKKVEVCKNEVRVSGYFNNCDVSPELAGKIRGSMYFLGLLLATLGEVKCGLPGGDQIGERPIDIHLNGLKKMGAVSYIDNGIVEASLIDKKLKGNRIYLKYPSVGATCNIMIAATRATGKTVIDNAAKEPEIVDLSNLLIEMGVRVSGAGTDHIIVYGTDEIHGNVVHNVIADRIETGVFAIATAMTGGNVKINRSVSYHNFPLIAVLKEIGVEIEDYENGIIVKSNGKIEPINVSMMPFPGIATDLQPALTVMATKAMGQSSVVDFVFQDRFQYVYELRRMGAEIEHYGNSLKINGKGKLIGNSVVGNDIRAVSALICAGLIADGITEIDGVNHLHRGYPEFDYSLKKLGADVVIK